MVGGSNTVDLGAEIPLIGVGGGYLESCQLITPTTR